MCSLCRSSAYLHIVDHHYCHLAVTRAPIPIPTLLLLLLPPRPLLQLRLTLFATGARSGARYFLSGGMGGIGGGSPSCLLWRAARSLIVGVGGLFSLQFARFLKQMLVVVCALFSN